MIDLKETVYNVDKTNKKISVSREFDAPVKDVWKAWTESTMLDEWWAPKPWQAVTRSINFKEGGNWKYYMEGPDGTKHHCRFDYESIITNKSFAGLDAFCDEDGKVLTDMPRLHWEVKFSPAGEGTRVDIDITSDKEESIDQIIEMGFKEGFAAAHKNLDELLAS